MGGILEEIMAQSPQTTATIYSLKSCDPTYKNVMYFPDGISVSNSLASMSVKTPLSYTNLQYIRDDGYVELPVIYDTAHDYNYIIYNNGEGEGSIFAFITNVEFLNFECTRFYIKKDVWMNYYKTASKHGIIERTHSATLSDIPDLPVQPSVQKGFITCDSRYNYYFGIQYVTMPAKNIIWYPTAFNKAVNIHVIYRYSNADNSITPYGEINFDYDKLMKNGRIFSMSIYYIPDEMLSKFKKYEDPYYSLNATETTSIKAYKLDRDSPMDSGSSFTRTITLSAPYINKFKYFNKFPYAQRTIYTAGGTANVNPLNFTGTINVKTSYYDGLSGMKFRHELSPQGIANDCIIYERSVNLPLIRDSYSDYIQQNIGTILAGVAQGVVTVGLGAYGANLGVLSAMDLYTRPGSTMSIEQYNRMAFSSVAPVVAGGTNNALNLAGSLINAAFTPNKIEPSEDGETAMLYLLPNMFAYSDVVLTNDVLNSCLDTINATGQKVSKIGTMSYNVGKYYTFLKMISYFSNIRNNDDAKEFENILLSGTTIWNMTSATDYKQYGEYVEDSENIIS